MNQTQVTLVDIRPEQLIDNLANNAVDAVIAWNPYVKMIEEKLGDNITVWAAQSEQSTHINAICTNNWAQEHPDTIKKFLRALIQAEDYIINNQTHTIDTSAKKLNYTYNYLSSIWSNYQFSISLDQALISQMEDQARWMINNNMTSAQTAPDFMNYICLDGLNDVRSRSVNIIGWSAK
jgi:sulfonate transport system substrate-binding protein